MSENTKPPADDTAIHDEPPADVPPLEYMADGRAWNGLCACCDVAAETSPPRLVFDVYAESLCEACFSAQSNIRKSLYEEYRPRETDPSSLYAQALQLVVAAKEDANLVSSALNIATFALDAAVRTEQNEKETEYLAQFTRRYDYQTPEERVAHLEMLVRYGSKRAIKEEREKIMAREGTRAVAMVDNENGGGIFKAGGVLRHRGD